MRHFRSAVLVSLLVLPGAAAAAPSTGELFPQAFRVEHQPVERERDGTVFFGETVRDTYGGSWIVSERPDGSRLVVDLARREMTEIRPAEGIYWTMGFARFAELRGRIAELERGPAAPAEPVAKAAGAGRPVAAPAAAEPEIELVELSGVAARSLADPAGRSAAAEETPAALAAPEIRKFAVRVGGAAEPAAEVWVDPRLRLGEAAQAALAAFEEDALGRTGGDRDAPAGSPPSAARLMAAVRRGTGGALPVFTSLPVYGGAGEKVGESEDRVLSTGRLEAFPAELARVPEGLVRASHPLESILAALEAQARIDAQLSGRATP